MNCVEKKEKEGASSSNGFRTHLPVPMFARSDFSVWSILKQCIGKELSKITMPVIFNEPLSFLQRLAEYLEYATLLKTAARTDDPILRMQYIAAFAVSSISSNWERIGKPFNPLLGETYELQRDDLGFHLVSEQVSHHPPVSAFHAQGDGYTIHGSIHPKLRFWGKSVEITPKGIITLTLSRYNEVYTWQNVNCCIHNVIIGKLWVEHSGTMEIQCHTSNVRAVINFKQGGWFGRDLHKVEGYIYSKKEKVKALYGSWVLGLFSSSVHEFENYQRPTSSSSSSTSAGNPLSVKRSASEASVDLHGKNKDENGDHDDLPSKQFSSYDLSLPSQTCLWHVTPRPSHSPQYFAFTSFALTLNQLISNMSSILPPTDARLRPDIRLMEEGNIDGAAEEKNRLEEKQRAARKDTKKGKSIQPPIWFQAGINPHTGKEDWIFTNKYFARDWSVCPDIF